MAITGSVFAIKKHGFKIKADMKDGKHAAYPPRYWQMSGSHICAA